MPTDYSGYVYAAILTVGGIFGYVKTGSVTLVVSLLLGSALAYGAHQLSEDSSNYTAELTVTTVLSELICYRFDRYYYFGKVSSGIICAVFLAVCIRSALVTFFNDYCEALHLTAEKSLYCFNYQKI